MVRSAKKRSCLDIISLKRGAEKATVEHQSSSRQPLSAFDLPLNNGAKNLSRNAQQWFDFSMVLAYPFLWFNNKQYSREREPGFQRGRPNDQNTFRRILKKGKYGAVPPPTYSRPRRCVN